MILFYWISPVSWNIVGCSIGCRSVRWKTAVAIFPTREFQSRRGPRRRFPYLPSLATTAVIALFLCWRREVDVRLEPHSLAFRPPSPSRSRLLSVTPAIATLLLRCAIWPILRFHAEAKSVGGESSKATRHRRRMRMMIRERCEEKLW